MNQSSVTRIIAAVIGGILRNFFAGAVIVVVAAHLLHALYVYLLDLQFWPQGWVERSIATLWLLLWTSFVAIAGAAVHFSCTAYSGLRANRLGICSGLRTAGSGHRIPALTDWLHQLIQDIAGAPLDKPLTFGDLEQSCPPISLAFMTTGISEMRAQRLPHTGASLLFRVSEISHLFPQEVVAWMRTHARKADADSRAMLKRYDPHAETDRQDLYFLPCTNDLPIVFCARMSLSFPVLLQAVPLLRKRFIHGDGLREGALELARVWFSDGGLTSNFPIHFFDTLLPVRPTFGVTLSNSLAKGADDKERVSLPNNNMHGITASFTTIDAADGLPSPVNFASALLNTIRGWRDEGLKRTPGFRDRIVEIRHTREEGGLNLNMSPAAISAMSASGVAAANAIIDRFLHLSPSKNGWINHRWVRMRTSAALLQGTLAPACTTWNSAALVPSYQSMWEGKPAVWSAAYPLTSLERSVGKTFWTELATTSGKATAVDFSKTGPRPLSMLAIFATQS